MGNVGAISVHPNQPSVTDPGLLSAWTDPIGEDLVDDVHEFFSELIEVCKDPVNDLLGERWFLKNLEVTPLGDPDEFEIKVILDGAKLKRVIPEKQDEEDFVRSRLYIKADRKTLTLTTAELAGEAGLEKKWHLFSRMHPNAEEKNFRTEIWLIDKEGVRRSGIFIAGFAEHLWVKPLLMCRFGQKVKVRSNIDVHESGGRSALSEPLDEFFTPDAFFESLVASVKQDVINAKAELNYKNDMEFDAKWDVELPLPENLQNKETGQTTFHLSAGKNVVTDPKGLQICIQDRFMGELMNSDFWRVHRDPCRIEFWKILPNGQRVGGGKEACLLRLKLLGMINEAAVLAEIQSLGKEEDNFAMF